jgi:hypothetical protein
MTGKLNVRNGKPASNSRLCRSCNWSQFTAGYRESELLVFCTRTDPNRAVPFVVAECSGFSDKWKPTFDQMKRLAISLGLIRLSPQTVGFGRPAAVVPIRGNEECDDEPAAQSRE